MNLSIHIIAEDAAQADGWAQVDNWGQPAEAQPQQSGIKKIFRRPQ